jgi:hypothetical protein
MYCFSLRLIRKFSLSPVLFAVFALTVSCTVAVSTTGRAFATPAPVYSQNWEHGAAGWSGMGVPLTLARDSSSPDGPTVQRVAGGEFYSPYVIFRTAGTYCLSVDIRWVGGNWPFVGIYGEQWLIGQRSDYYPKIVPVPQGAKGWNNYRATFSVPSATGLKFVDELWNRAAERGAPLAYFDGFIITRGSCGRTTHRVR